MKFFWKGKRSKRSFVVDWSRIRIKTKCRRLFDFHDMLVMHWKMIKTEEITFRTWIYWLIMMWRIYEIIYWLIGKKVNISRHSSSPEVCHFVVLIYSTVWISAQVDSHTMPIVENGTSFSEEIELDETRDVEVFRVPAHNGVNAADFFLDFKMVSLVSELKQRRFLRRERWPKDESSLQLFFSTVWFQIQTRRLCI